MFYLLQGKYDRAINYITRELLVGKINLHTLINWLFGTTVKIEQVSGRTSLSGIYVWIGSLGYSGSGSPSTSTVHYRNMYCDLKCTGNRCRWGKKLVLCVPFCECLLADVWCSSALSVGGLSQRNKKRLRCRSSIKTLYLRCPGCYKLSFIQLRISRMFFIWY